MSSPVHGTPEIVIVGVGGTERCPRAGTLFVVSELLSAEGLFAMTLFGEPASSVGRRELEDVARATPLARLLTVRPSSVEPGALVLTLAATALGDGPSEVLEATRSLLETPRGAAQEIVAWLRALVPTACVGPEQPTTMHDPDVVRRELAERSLFVAALGFDLVPFAEVNASLRRFLDIALPVEGAPPQWPHVVEAAADLRVLGKRIADHEAHAFDHGWRRGHARTLAEALLARVEATPASQAPALAAQVSRATLLWTMDRYREADDAFAALLPHDEAFASFARGMLAEAHAGLEASVPHMKRVLTLLADDAERTFPDHARQARWEAAIEGRGFLDLTLSHLARCALERNDAEGAVDFAERALTCTRHPVHGLRLLARGLTALTAREKDATKIRALRERNLDALERAHAAAPHPDDTKGALALAKALGDPTLVARWTARDAGEHPVATTLTISV